MSRTAEPRASLSGRGVALLLGALAVALVWAYWPAFVVMSRKWAHDPQYSHGWLVPLFALGLLWTRRERLELGKLRPSGWGLPLLALGIGLRLVAAHFYYEWIDWISLLPCLAGIVLLAGGGHALRWSWMAVLFLGFMIPLPHSLETALQGPLRMVGTKVSTYLMQTIGLPAFAEGHVIVVGDVQIGIVEACSGLRMLMIFFALSTAVALLSPRRTWERLLIAASAVPIALIANVLRITVTGVLYATGYGKLADLVFHDLAGWLMMPIGLLLLWFELWFLNHLFIVEEVRPMAVGLGPAPPLPAKPGASRELSAAR